MVNPGGTEEGIKNNMRAAMIKYGDPQSQDVTNSWDAIQEELQCCGIEREIDWDNEGKPEGKVSCRKKADCKGAECQNRTISDNGNGSLLDLKDSCTIRNGDDGARQTCHADQLSL